jgi:hypothetical protein
LKRKFGQSNLGKRKHPGPEGREPFLQVCQSHINNP